MKFKTTFVAVPEAPEEDLAKILTQRQALIDEDAAKLMETSAAISISINAAQKYVQKGDATAVLEMLQSLEKSLLSQNCQATNCICYSARSTAGSANSIFQKNIWHWHIHMA